MAGDRLRRRAWLLYLGAVVPLAVLYLVGPSTLNTGPVFNAIGLSAIVAIVAGNRQIGRGRRLPWLMFALGQTLFVAGDVIAYNYDRFFHTPLPFPSIADVLYLAVYPALVSGILLLIRARTPGGDGASLIDSLVIALGLGVLSWVFLMAPYAHDHSQSLSTKMISIAYPLMDILLLTVTARLAFGTGRRERPFYLLVVGAISLLVTDSVYGWLQLHGGYDTGGLLDAGWIAFYLLWGAAALHPAARSVGERALTPEPGLTFPRLAILAATSLVVPLVQAVEFSLGTRIDVPVTAAAGGTIFLLVMARMIGLMRKQEQGEARFSSLVRNSSDVVAVIDRDTTIRYVSPSVERVLGYRSAELVGTRFSELLDEDELALVANFLLSGDEGGAPALVPFECRMRHRDGRWLEVETFRTNLLADPSVGGIVLNTRDVSDRRAFERELELHAFYDTVTGLANRSLFRDRVDHALAQAHRSGRTVTVMFMDLDDFKNVNDSFGHATGDALLKEVGERLKTCLRVSDTAARLGGDEFAMLIDPVDDEVDPTEVAERIMLALESPFLVEGRELAVRASLGIAVGNADQGERATDELLRNADVAMYEAKGRGKSRYAFYVPTMYESVLERLELKREIQPALEQHEFVLRYQPIVNPATMRISGLEALVRWDHPQRGRIAPADFIPLAEETGLIVPLGSRVLETACREARSLQQRFPSFPPLSIAVNLSSRQLQWSGVVADVESALHSSGLPPSSLTLEVTETVMMQNIEKTAKRLHELKALGVQIAIDDFGAGYSSLSHVQRFPLDILKVDKSFIDRIDESGDELAVAAAIIRMAKTLGLRPVAEGVERQEQRERLIVLGCDLAQGHYFAKPGSREEIEEHLGQERRKAAA